MTDNELADQIEEALADQRVEGLEKFSIYGHREDWKRVMEVLRTRPEGSFVEKLQALKIGHDYCEDPWYSCPLSPEGCADDRKGPGCECGADAHNAKVDALIAACSPQSQEGK